MFFLSFETQVTPVLAQRSLFKLTYIHASTRTTLGSTCMNQQQRSDRHAWTNSNAQIDIHEPTTSLRSKWTHRKPVLVALAYVQFKCFWHKNKFSTVHVSFSLRLPFYCRSVVSPDLYSYAFPATGRAVRLQRRRIRLHANRQTASAPHQLTPANEVHRGNRKKGMGLNRTIWFHHTRPQRRLFWGSPLRASMV